MLAYQPDRTNHTNNEGERHKDGGMYPAKTVIRASTGVSILVRESLISSNRCERSSTATERPPAEILKHEDC